MILVDTSVWIDVFRDKSQRKRKALLAALAGDEVVLTRFTQLELLQGCRDRVAFAVQPDAEPTAQEIGWE